MGGFVSERQLLLCLFSTYLRSLLQPVTQSWVERTSTRCWSSISVRNLARLTSLMSSLSPGLWSGSTKSVKNWKNWWVPIPQTCLWTLSASWMTLMSLQNWTGQPTIFHSVIFIFVELSSFSYKAWFNLSFILKFAHKAEVISTFSLTPGVSLKRCVLIFCPE